MQIFAFTNKSMPKSWSIVKSEKYAERNARFLIEKVCYKSPIYIIFFSKYVYK